MPWPRASLRRSNTSCSPTRRSPRTPTRDRPSSNSSKCGTTDNAVIRVSITSVPSTTKSSREQLNPASTKSGQVQVVSATSVASVVCLCALTHVACSDQETAFEQTTEGTEENEVVLCVLCALCGL